MRGHETPLAGVRVVDLTSLLPGGMATRLLADLGARVVKVEPPGGEAGRQFPPLVNGVSAYYLATAAGKRVRFLDLKTPRGRASFERLLSSADVLLHSLRRGAASRLGLSPSEVARRHPRLVQVRIAGFRDSDKAGHDLTFLASSGLLDLNRDPKGRPVVPGFQIADVAGGTWPAVAAIRAGLYERQRTGRGSTATVSLHEGSLALAVFAAAEYLALGREPGAERLVTPEGHPCYGLYPTKDRRWLAVAAIERKFWTAFCEAVKAPDLVPHQYARGASGERARRRLSAITSGKTLAEWRRLLDPLDVCVTPVVTVREAIEAERRASSGLVRRLRGGRSEIVPRIR